jgi:hypothetical protein
MSSSFYSAFRDPELSRDNFIREPLRGQSGYFRFASLQSLITIKFSHSALQLELLIIAPCGFGQFDVVDACRTEVGHKQSPKRKSPSLGLEGAGASQLRGGTQHSRYMPPRSQWLRGLSSLSRCSTSRRWSARLDIDCLGGLYGLRGLLDREMQHALVEMSVDGSVLRLEWQGHRSVE